MAGRGLGAWPAPARLLAALAGDWILERTVESADPGQCGSLSGQATFAPGGEGRLAYREDGLLTLGAGSFRAERRYLFAARPDGFAVLFDERPPRLFHEIALVPEAKETLAGSAEHRCGADLYVSRYRFGPDGGFVVEHRVAGPRKDYRIESRYRRPPTSPAA